MKKAYLTLDPPREPDGTLCRTGLRRSAPVVLLPGDPQRSRKMAALFAEASFTAHRGTFATYTGKTPGRRGYRRHKQRHGLCLRCRRTGGACCRGSGGRYPCGHLRRRAARSGPGDHRHCQWLRPRRGRKL